MTEVKDNFLLDEDQQDFVFRNIGLMTMHVMSGMIGVTEGFLRKEVEKMNLQGMQRVDASVAQQSILEFIGEDFIPVGTKRYMTLLGSEKIIIPCDGGVVSRTIHRAMNISDKEDDTNDAMRRGVGAR